MNIDNAFATHEQAIALRARRTELLVSNLANADTPNFKARDINFRQALQQASQADLRTTHHDHLQAGGAGTRHDSVVYRVPTQPSLDGNTVETEVEKAQFAENAVRYQASLQFFSSRISSLVRTLKGE